jgi:hypothetical protein
MMPTDNRDKVEICRASDVVERLDYGTFDITTGKPESSPCTVALGTFPSKSCME